MDESLEEVATAIDQAFQESIKADIKGNRVAKSIGGEWLSRTSKE